MQVSGKGVGWEQIGEITGDLTGDLTGDFIVGLNGLSTGDLVSELGGDEAESLTGEAAAAETGAGEGTDKGSWTGAVGGHSGLLAAGEGIVLSGFVSSDRNGSEKNRVPGDFTRGIWKGNRDDQDLVKTTITHLQLNKFGINSPVSQALVIV